MLRKHHARVVPLLIGIVVALFSFLAFAGSAQAVTYSTEELAFAKLLNDYRVSQGLQPLLISDALSESADRHSRDMGTYGFFSHNTVRSDWFATGATPWDRVAASGYTYNTVKGENIAAGMSTARAVFDGWENSSVHNATMLNGDFKVLGVSLVTVSGSPDGSYWTVDFGGSVDPTAHSTTSTQPSSSTTTIVHLPASFRDVGADTLYAAEIVELAERGIVVGYADGTFCPLEPVTRQQFAKMITLTMGYELSLLAPCGFSDVASRLDARDPLYPRAYVAACVAEGVVQGRTTSSFDPYAPVSRAQLITMVARAAELPPASPYYRPPFGFFSADHYPNAAAAADAGLLNGLAGMGPSYDFWSPATRGEVCLLLSTLLR